VVLCRFHIFEYGVCQDLALLKAYDSSEANLTLMKTASRLAALLFVLTAYTYGQATSVRTEDFPVTPALSSRVAHFDQTHATLIDALSKLSNEPIAGLHLGIEEIIQDKFSEPTDRSARFSLIIVFTT
jgi:hypothetical protein